MAWPAAGASSTIRSAVPPRSSCFTLPSTRMSSIPGAAVATTSSTPAPHEPLRQPAQPVVVEVLEQGRVGGDRPGRGSRPCRPARAAAQHHLVVAELAVGRRAARPRPLLPSTSTTRTRRPAPAAAAARAAVTVVLPTPPLPATMTSREAAKNCIGSTVPLRRRCVRRLAIACSFSAAVLGALPRWSACPDAGAQAATARRGGRAVDVFEVSGLLDPIVVDERRAGPRRRRADGAQAAGAAAEQPGAAVVAARRWPSWPSGSTTRGPVGIWVGPSGARAYGTPASCSARPP